ncbi:MAG: hypothetical protein EAZ89_15315, partial [Bacteroidetes bacterium]
MSRLRHLPEIVFLRREAGVRLCATNPAVGGVAAPGPDSGPQRHWRLPAALRCHLCRGYLYPSAAQKQALQTAGSAVSQRRGHRRRRRNRPGQPPPAGGQRCAACVAAFERKNSLRHLHRIAGTRSR